RLSGDGGKGDACAPAHQAGAGDTQRFRFGPEVAAVACAMTARRFSPTAIAGFAVGLLAAAAAAPCLPAKAASQTSSARPAASQTPSAAIASRSFHSTDRVRLHVLESRPANASSATVAIVLVPGWSMPASLFRPQLQALGRRHHVIAFDPRGQG